ncbi:MAG: hypothetical protein JO244_15425, partial [Solirubrobacterales bacterium]|nr:hypothetical protein [Solirubrobacterales bacterium]
MPNSSLTICAHLLVVVWHDADWDIQHLGKMQMFAVNLTLLTPVLLLVWLLAFPGFRWRTKGIVLAVVAILVAGTLAAIREVRVTGNLG